MTVHLVGQLTPSVLSFLLPAIQALAAAGRRQALLFVEDGLASEQLATHKSLLERGDGLALAQYLTLREQMQATLEERAAAGGSRSLNSSSNADLRGIWDEFTTDLVASDIGFEQMWNRVLGENAEGELRDDLTGRLYAREGGGE